MNLPQDTLNEIMNHLDLSTLRYYCSTNKETLKICSSPSFWEFKLNEYNLPMILSPIHYPSGLNYTIQNKYIKTNLIF